jgi:hypothetical protein
MQEHLIVVHGDACDAEVEAITVLIEANHQKILCLSVSFNLCCGYVCTRNSRRNRSKHAS